MRPSLLDDFEARGLIADVTHRDELAQHFAAGPRSVYCGFDPTADSLHIGSLLPLLSLRRIQQAGHRPLVLIGGGTGLIGSQVVQNLRARGHEAVPASPNTGVNTITGEGVDAGNAGEPRQ